MCLCIRKDQSGNINVTMVCDGFLDPDDKKDESLYFSLSTFNNHNYTCKSVHKNLLPPNTTMMFVRHGNGFHNSEAGVMGLFKKNLKKDIYKDALLTDLGKEQAIQASVAILHYLNTITQNVVHCIYFCASILRRAIETSGIILESLNICAFGTPCITKDSNVFVFYGINEIIDCSGNTGTFNPENKPTCIRPGVTTGNNCSTLYVHSGDYGSFNISLSLSSLSSSSTIASAIINVKFPLYPQLKKYDVLSIFDQVRKFGPTTSHHVLAS